MLNVLSRISRSPNPQFGGQIINGGVGSIQGNIDPAKPGPFQGQIINGPIGQINGQSSSSIGLFSKFPKSLTCNCPNNQSQTPGTWICVKGEQPQCTCQCKPFVVYEPASTTTNSVPRTKRQWGNQQINGGIGQICVGDAPEKCNEPQNGAVSHPDQSNLPSGSLPGGNLPSGNLPSSTLPSSGTTAPSQIRPMEELVNDSGVKYKAHYFNSHITSPPKGRGGYTK